LVKAGLLNVLIGRSIVQRGISWAECGFLSVVKGANAARRSRTGKKLADTEIIMADMTFFIKKT
jgi:hypothetical protein